MPTQLSIRILDEYSGNEFDIPIAPDVTLGEFIESIKAWDRIGPQNHEFQLWLNGDNNRLTKFGIYNAGALQLENQNLQINILNEYGKKLSKWGLKEGAQIKIIRHGGH